jgi:DNA topoisomerase-3
MIWNNKISFSQREGFSRFNKIYEFNHQLFNQPVQMIFTSVSGHLMTCDFTAPHKSWTKVDPVVLFDAPIQKKVTDRALDIEV